MPVIEYFNLQEFETFTKDYQGLMVIDFYASWCGPCKLMLPIFDKLAQEENLQHIAFAKINRDENQELIEKYDFVIPTIPRFFLVKVDYGNVEILLDMEGTQSKTQLINKITPFLEAQEKALEAAHHPHDPNQHPKVAIIGSGPSGLTAAIYAARASLDVTVYSGNMPGGQLTTTTEIENFPGAWNPETKEGLYGSELMDTIQKQAEHFGAKVEFANVTGIEYQDNNGKPSFTISDSNEEVKTYDGVIIASGATARYLNLPDEARFVGRGYHSCATCDGAFYKQRQVAIVGGGDSAMEEADFLSKFADKVYLLHRSQKFRASQIMLERTKSNPKIEIIMDTAVANLVGEKKLEYIILKSTTDSTEHLDSNQVFEKIGDNQYKLVLDGLFVAIGHDPNTSFVKNLLDTTSSGYLIPQSRLPQDERTSKYAMATKIPGLFVAGDVEDQEYRQAITAAAGGCRAAMELEKWLAEI